MNADGMISVEEARARILDAIERLPAETKRLEEALGQDACRHPGLKAGAWARGE